MDSVLASLLRQHEPPCLSLYQPTHRRHPENQQDPIRYRNLVKTLEESLHSHHPSRDLKALLDPFHAIAGSREFWRHTLDGLAVLRSGDFFHAIRLPRPVPELAIVADSFHIKPLMRIVQSADRYQVLALDRQSVRMFEGNRDELGEIELAPGVPRTIKEALGSELTGPHQTVASYGGIGGASVAMRHGHGSKADEIDADTERFFRVIDRAVAEHHSKESELPLLLAALPEYHATFRKVSTNPALLPEGIETHPDSQSLEELRARAWKALERRYRARLAALSEQFREAKSKGLGSDDLGRIGPAASAGRVGTVLLEAERHIPGRLDPGNGAVTLASSDHPEVDDVLDDIGETVLRLKGEVVVVPAGDMPSRTGIAAIYRF